MATTTAWYISSDNTVQLDEFYDPLGAAYLNAATVTVTVKDISGDSVTGISWPITMDYVAASNGKYRGTVDKAISVVDGATYFAEITAAEGTIDKFFRIQLLAQYA